jgi:adenosylcobinamide-phosphate synthase
VLPAVVLAGWLCTLPLGWLLHPLLLCFALGGRALEEHGMRVADDLAAGNLAAAREHVGWMVSRDTSALDETGVSKAAVESLLENGNDAVFGALFWFFLLGGPGALLFRLANTLDAMWGYRNERFLCFGAAAARLDDALNYLPARLTALSYALFGNTRRALACWRKQAPQWDSPNAGPVMAAGAGSLQVALGGPAVYHGHLEVRPVLGEGRAPQASDIQRALTLVRHGVRLWLVTAFVVGAMIALAAGMAHA